MYAKSFILAVTVLMSVAVHAWAYQNGCPGTGHYRGFMDGLAPARQEKVQEITGAHHEQLFALHQELEAQVVAMDALLAVVPPDTAAIATLNHEINTVQAKKNTLNTDYRIQLVEILGSPLPKNTSGRCGSVAPCPGWMPGRGQSASEGNAPSKILQGS